MQFLQDRAGFQADLVDEVLAALAERLHRLGASPGAVLGEHELGTGLFPQWLVLHERGQLADQLAVPAELEVQRGAFLLDRELLLFEPLDLDLHQRGVDVAQRAAPPQGQRLVVAFGGLADLEPVGERASLGDLGPEGQQVDLVLGAAQHVARRRGKQHVVAQPKGSDGLPQFGDADRDLGPGCRGGMPVPDRFRDPVDGDDPIRIQQEHGQYDPLPRTAYRNPLFIELQAQGPEQAKFETIGHEVFFLLPTRGRQLFRCPTQSPQRGPPKRDPLECLGRHDVHPIG